MFENLQYNNGIELVVTLTENYPADIHYLLCTYIITSCLTDFRFYSTQNLLPTFENASKLLIVLHA